MVEINNLECVSGRVLYYVHHGEGQGVVAKLTDTLALHTEKTE